MRRLIFGLLVAASVAAYSQSAAGTTVASTGTTGASTGAAAARHNPNDVEWTQHGGNPNEQRYSKLNQVTADNLEQIVDHLDDLTLDIDEHKTKVHIFCE